MFIIQLVLETKREANRKGNERKGKEKEILVKLVFPFYMRRRIGRNSV